MNQYWAIAALAAFIGWSGFMYHEGGSKESAVCAKVTEGKTIAEQSNTISAQNGVIATVAQQQAITQGVEHDYQAKKNAIDSRYIAAGGMQSAGANPARGDMPSPTYAACRPHGAPARPLVTRVFGLSAKECDDNTEQLYSLQNWVRKQQTVKPLTH